MVSMGEAREIRKEKRFKELRDARESLNDRMQPNIQNPNHRMQPKIQKVPFMLRDQKNFEKYYVPRAVAIGPFHHGNPRCKLTQEYKLKLTSYFAQFVDQKEEDLYKKIEEKIKELRECYVKEETEDIDDDTLAWMLFLDGCSTLQFMYSRMHKQEELEKLFDIKRDQVAFAQQDLFLLENQIPYKVLELLMSSSNKCEELKHAIESFVQIHIIVPVEKQSKGQEQKQEPDRTASKEHKVDITENTETKQQEGLTTDADQKQQPGVATDGEPTHLLDLLRKKILGPPKEDDPKKGVREFSKPTFRNVQELSEAGIHFQPGKTHILRNISFESHCFAGFLSLPPISVDDSTGPKFMNLIAYEMCLDFQNDYGVTSYIGFLDALVDHADDVKKLRSASVLFNFLGSDAEVAQLFNEIGTDLVPNTDIYLSVKAKLEKHYKTKWKTWMSQFCHDHFSSPWTILAFLGVLSALGLSGIQTWYTIDSQHSPCEAVCHYLKTRLHIK